MLKCMQRNDTNLTPKQVANDMRNSDSTKKDRNDRNMNNLFKKKLRKTPKDFLYPVLNLKVAKLRKQIRFLQAKIQLKKTLIMEQGLKKQKQEKISQKNEKRLNYLLINST